MTNRVAIKALAWAVSIAAVLAGAYFGRFVPFSQQWPLYEALRTTAAIIFAVVGAWMAIVFPERMRGSFRQDGTSVPGNQSGIGKFFTPVAHSTGVLCIILALGVSAPLLKQSAFLLTHVEYVRGLSYACLIALTFFQLFTVVLTLVPADAIKTHADEEEERVRQQRGRDLLVSSATNPNP